MSDSLDLNAIRQTILNNRASGQDLPSTPASQIAVDNTGKIVDRSKTSGVPEQKLSQVHQGTFA